MYYTYIYNIYKCLLIYKEIYQPNPEVSTIGFPNRQTCQPNPTNPQEMREDPQVVFQAVSQQGLALQFAEAEGSEKRRSQPIHHG